MTSIWIVLAGAISFALMGSNNSEKIEFFSKGAVTFGWIGFLHCCLNTPKSVEEDPAGIGPAAECSSFNSAIWLCGKSDLFYY